MSHLFEPDRFTFLNIAPFSPGSEELLAREMVEYRDRTGEDIVLYCLSFHPEGRPAIAKAEYLVESYRRLRRALEGSGIRLGVLMQSTLGHWPVVAKDEEPWTHTITLDGKTKRFCPADPGCRQYLHDKPFCVTEFNYSGPGRFRGVGGVVLGTLAALQNWSGLWRFAWSHSRGGIVKPGGQLGYFDVAGDPLALAAERAALCLFLRRDLEPFTEERPAVFDEATLRNPEKGAVDFPGPDQPLALGWEARVGTRVVRAGTVPGAQGSNPRVAAPAPSGNVSVDSATGSMLLDTQRTAGGFAESGAHTAGPLRFALFGDEVSRRAAEKEEPQRIEENLRASASSAPRRDTKPVPATIWVSSLDGAPIATSSHLLLTHLTDIQNKGIEYADPELTTLLRWGSLPHIMRNGVAEIELNLAPVGTVPGAQNSDKSVVLPAPSGNVTVYRLSSSGKRLGEVPATYDPTTGFLSLTARTDYDPSTATYLYEIVRK